ncbi:glycosyltransferase family 4 protein [Subsaxibacter sp. CAU 1640]|uniref:glycosyltransferase family 4 protein n=1 Tax=Subsaxibacter sp. CAU 1640 TaxID=2933271 RepID=UPI002004F9AC|nr:glycosyltransferase family 4 protein [Subsaxibacter sp. CAU 1640]MCK7590221.1 glycosyltransferase family 4 protein [Subsaxibacter sp. CAU 1640]
MKRKKILIVIDWFLPGTNSGGPVRSYANLIAHLGSYHDFYIITRDTDYCSDEVYTDIQSDSWNQLNEHMSVYYFSKEALNKSNLKQVIDDTAFDIAYINGIYSWYFSILPLWFLRKHPHVIVAARGMLNPQAFSVKKTKKRWFLAIAKLLDLYKGVRFHATNDDEANYIKQILGKGTHVLIAPNLARMSPSNEPKIRKSDPVKFVNVARVSKEKGTLTMLEALKNVSSPMILDYYGPVYDEAYWRLCQKSIEEIPKHVCVTYKGILPSEDVPSVLCDYDFFVLLSEGENFGHAILESFMSGLPVIISDQTPWKNLKNKDLGWDVGLNTIHNISQTFDEAIALSNDRYHEMSAKTVDFAREFSTNPELLVLNLNLFKF